MGYERGDELPVVGGERVLVRESRAEAERAAASLEGFVTQHYPRLIRLAGLVTHDLYEAQDAVQSALERAWRGRSSLEDSSRLRPWLDRIVVREAIRIGRRRSSLLGRLLGAHPQVTEITTADSQPGPAELVSLRLAYGHLTADHRAVIALHLHAGYTVAETAQLLGVPHDTVRSRLRAARDRLRREMAEVTP
jgi:RNA polymerase sigma-70 factor, ECF subfamily